jgi:SAM-dependent methyltransferase
MGTIGRIIGRWLLKAIAMVLSCLGRDKKHLVYQACLRRVGSVIANKDRLELYRAEMRELIEPEERFLIPSFEGGRSPEQDRFHAYQQRYVPFSLQGCEKVLDIGSGAHPFPLATHQADLFLNRTSHRFEPFEKTGLPLFVCDVEKLPCSDKSFDFVYCSHVLEHVVRPSRACEELMRVGKKGYIETPTRMSDVMFNYIRLPDHHLWHVTCLGGTLIFMEWEDRERRDTHIYDFYAMAKSRYTNAFQELFHGHRDLFVNMMLWEQFFPYYVFDKKGHLIETNSPSAGHRPDRMRAMDESYA